jgi:CRISPR/Cas system-associated exonuclease Cas4 (RecB family)
MIAMVEPAPSPTHPNRIEELKRTVSASRLNCWQGCRLKFYFRYVLEIKKSRSAALFVGSMVHSVLQGWNLARWREGKVDTEKLKLKLNEDWHKELKQQPVYWDVNEETEARTETWSLFETYLKHTPITLEEKPEAVEVTMEADLSQHGLPKLIGIIDLVRKGGRIVDFKTSSITPNAERIEHLHETQMSAYAVLYRDGVGMQEGGLELHHLVKLKTPKLVVSTFPPMTESQKTRFFRIMESYVEGLERRDWIPSPNPMSCAGCEYFNECRKWS